MDLLNIHKLQNRQETENNYAKQEKRELPSLYSYNTKKFPFFVPDMLAFLVNIRVTETLMITLKL